MIKDKNLTKEQAQSIFIQDPKNGDLYKHQGLRDKCDNDAHVLQVIKSYGVIKPIRAKKDSHGRKYYVTRINKYGTSETWMTTVHRLVWNLHHGKIPDGRIIDHINNNSLDNRIDNLQCITQSENIKRCVKTEKQIESFSKYFLQPVKSGVKGLYTDGNKQYIRLPSGKKKYLTDDNREELLSTL